MLARWLRARKLVFLHVPNEGRRTHYVAARLKAEGLQAGAPDYLIFSATDDAPRGAAVELKRQKPDFRPPTPLQKGWLERLEALGVRTVVGAGAADAISQLQELGY